MVRVSPPMAYVVMVACYCGDIATCMLLILVLIIAEVFDIKLFLLAACSLSSLPASIFGGYLSTSNYPDVSDYSVSRDSFDLREERSTQINNSSWEEEEYVTSEPSIAHVTSPSSEEAVQLWSVIVDWVQFGFTTTGFLANVLTLVTLYVNGQGFSRMMVVLFRHQAFADAVVCLVASIVILQPFMWLTGNWYVDQLVCHIWHGQAVYWGFVTISTYNLVLIAYERYVSVCRPFNYADLEAIPRSKVLFYYFLLYLFTIFITHGTYIQTKLDEEGCTNQYAFQGPHMERYFKFFVIFTYITTYLMPALIMGSLYGLVAYTLRMRGKDTRLAHSRLVDRASADLTKTAVVVTVIFVVSIGYDLHYYLLGHTGAVVYHLNTPIQKVGVFLSNINSTCNPFVYALLMPLYRRSVRKTLSCEREAGLRKTPVTSSNSSNLEMTHGGSVSTIA